MEPGQKDIDISNDGWRTVYRERIAENAMEEEKRRLKKHNNFLARQHRDHRRATRRAGQAIVGHAGAGTSIIGEAEAAPRKMVEEQRTARNRAGHQRQARQRQRKREARRAEQEQQNEESMY